MSRPNSTLPMLGMSFKEWVFARLADQCPMARALLFVIGGQHWTNQFQAYQRLTDVQTSRCFTKESVERANTALTMLSVIYYPLFLAARGTLTLEQGRKKSTDFYTANLKEFECLYSNQLSK